MQFYFSLFFSSWVEPFPFFLLELSLSFFSSWVEPFLFFLLELSLSFFFFLSWAFASSTSYVTSYPLFLLTLRLTLILSLALRLVLIWRLALRLVLIWRLALRLVLIWHLALRLVLIWRLALHLVFIWCLALRLVLIGRLGLRLVITWCLGLRLVVIWCLALRLVLIGRLGLRLVVIWCLGLRLVVIWCLALRLVVIWCLALRLILLALAPFLRIACVGLFPCVISCAARFPRVVLPLRVSIVLSFPLRLALVLSFALRLTLVFLRCVLPSSSWIALRVTLLLRCACRLPFAPHVYRSLFVCVFLSLFSFPVIVRSPICFPYLLSSLLSYLLSSPLSHIFLPLFHISFPFPYPISLTSPLSHLPLSLHISSFPLRPISFPHLLCTFFPLRPYLSPFLTPIPYLLPSPLSHISFPVSFPLLPSPPISFPLLPSPPISFPLLPLSPFLSSPVSPFLSSPISFPFLFSLPIPSHQDGIVVLPGGLPGPGGVTHRSAWRGLWACTFACTRLPDHRRHRPLCRRYRGWGGPPGRARARIYYIIVSNHVKKARKFSFVVYFSKKRDTKNHFDNIFFTCSIEFFTMLMCGCVGGNTCTQISYAFCKYESALEYSPIL